MTEPARLHPDTMLSKSDLCARAGICHNTVTRLISREENPLPAVRIPGTRIVRIRWGDFQEWLEPYNDAARIDGRALLRESLGKAS